MNGLERVTRVIRMTSALVLAWLLGEFMPLWWLLTSVALIGVLMITTDALRVLDEERKGKEVNKRDPGGA